MRDKALHEKYGLVKPAGSDAIEVHTRLCQARTSYHVYHVSV